MSLRELHDSLREVEVEVGSKLPATDGSSDEIEGVAECSLDELDALVAAEASEESLQEDAEMLRRAGTSILVDAAEARTLLELVADQSDLGGEELELALLEAADGSCLQTSELLSLFEAEAGEPRQADSPTSVTALLAEDLLSLGGSVYDAVSSPAPLPDLCFCGEPAQSPPPHSARAGRTCADRKEWTAEEDATIRSHVQLFGCKWRRIAALLPGRSDDSVRNRWNRLQAALSQTGQGGVATPMPVAARPPKAPNAGKPERTSWTKAEDATILNGVQELGHRWGKLAQRLPGRTEHAIRNRFHRLQTMHEDSQPPLSVVSIPAVLSS